MKITAEALRRLIKESLNNTKIVKERPWSVEHEFVLTSGKAEDSEGTGPDGFAIVLSGDSGKTMRVIVDTYWNPQSGDQSGNSLKIETDGQKPEASSTYVPVRFDSGKKQRLIISNSPVSGLISVAHAASLDSLPIVMLVVANPFDVDEDIEFSTKNLGNGKFEAELTDFSSL